MLGGVGYYLYLTDSLNLDFLKKGIAVVEPVAVVENQQEVKEDAKIDPKIFGYYFSPHGAIGSYLILKNDGTFIHTGRFDGNNYPDKLKGKFSVENFNLKLVYDDKYTDLVLQINTDNRSGTIYIKGQGDQPKKYSGYYFVKGEDEMVNLIEDKKSDVPTPPKTNTTTTYMCSGKVKIVREQDSPSLPPRISYLRARDGASVAYYGDMGAYIRPEYFSIDREQIEEGYSFNETNFCKYLKN